MSLKDKVYFHTLSFCLLSGLRSGGSSTRHSSPRYCCLATHGPKNNVAKWPWMNFRPAWVTYWDIVFFIFIFFYFQAFSDSFYSHGLYKSKLLSPVENRLRHFFTQENSLFLIEDYFDSICSHCSWYLLFLPPPHLFLFLLSNSHGMQHSDL